MKGLDTDILVRLLVADDAPQTQLLWVGRARRISPICSSHVPPMPMAALRSSPSTGRPPGMICSKSCECDSWPGWVVLPRSAKSQSAAGRISANSAATSVCIASHRSTAHEEVLMEHLARMGGTATLGQAKHDATRSPSVVIDNFNILRPCVRPSETDAVLVVDPNRVLPGSIAQGP